MDIKSALLFPAGQSCKSLISPLGGASAPLEMEVKFAV